MIGPVVSFDGGLGHLSAADVVAIRAIPPVDQPMAPPGLDCWRVHVLFSGSSAWSPLTSWPRATDAATAARHEAEALALVDAVAVEMERR